MFVRSVLFDWFARLRFWRGTDASYLAKISTVDLADGQQRGLDFAHRFEPISIAGQKILCV